MEPEIRTLSVVSAREKIFGASRRVLCIGSTLSTTFVLLIAIVSVYYGSKWEKAALCATICPCNSDKSAKDVQIPSACEFSLFSAFSAPVIFFTILCIILQIVALTLSFFYFYRGHRKGFIAAHIFTLIPLAICAQSLWAFMLVDIGAGNGIGNFSLETDGEVLSDDLILSTADFTYFVCETHYVIRPSFAFAFMFALLTYFLSIFSCCVHYFFAVTLEGPTVSDYFHMGLRKLIFMLRYGSIKNVNELNLNTVFVKVRLQSDPHFVEMDIPEDRSFEGLLHALESKFNLSEESHIVKVLKNGDTLVSNDADVRRLSPFNELVVMVENGNGEHTQL